MGVETRLTLETGRTMVLPAATRHQTEVAVNLGALRSAGVEPDITPLSEVSGPLAELRVALTTLSAALDLDAGHDPLAEAQHAQDALLPAMAAVRAP